MSEEYKYNCYNTNIFTVFLLAQSQLAIRVVLRGEFKLEVSFI